MGSSSLGLHHHPHHRQIISRLQPEGIPDVDDLAPVSGFFGTVFAVYEEEGQQFVVRDGAVGVGAEGAEGEYTVGGQGEVLKILGGDALIEDVPIVVEVFVEVIAEVIRLIVVVELYDLFVAGDDSVADGDDLGVALLGVYDGEQEGAQEFVGVQVQVGVEANEVSEEGAQGVLE